MARLIDADALPEGRVEWEDIAEAPTIDAVHVINCKDCGWYDVTRYTAKGLPDKRCKLSYCLMLSHFVEPDFYCGFGTKEKNYLYEEAVPLRHAKWIDMYDDACVIWLERECSNCGLVFEDEPHDYEYCPHCGAKMDAR